MKVNFRKQKYILPIIALPFLFLGNYLYRDTFTEEEVVVVGNDGLQDNISEASSNVREAEMSDKLDAYANTYRGADGYTAISGIGHEEENLPQYENLYSNAEKRRIDSLQDELDRKLDASRATGNVSGGSGYVPQSRGGSASNPDDELLKLLTATQTQSANGKEDTAEQGKPYDPMEMMKEQYRLMDSMEKANDPEYKAELARQEQQEKAEKEAERLRLRKMTVQRANVQKGGFNTVRREEQREFIKAIIDENVTGYAGSRIRIRLLEDIKIGNNLIKKGTYLYALINGFSEQRVTMQIISVMHKNSVLPINLSIYDLDGMEGLYVPSSSFREFTKELGSSSMQGMNMSNGNSQTQSEFLMSTMQRAFQSTSQAIANAIRKNKASFKYNSFVYLIDTQELQELQNQKN